MGRCLGSLDGTGGCAGTLDAAGKWVVDREGSWVAVKPVVNGV